MRGATLAMVESVGYIQPVAAHDTSQIANHICPPSAQTARVGDGLGCLFLFVGRLAVVMHDRRGIEPALRFS